MTANNSSETMSECLILLIWKLIWSLQYFSESLSNSWLFLISWSQMMVVFDTSNRLCRMLSIDFRFAFDSSFKNLSSFETIVFRIEFENNWENLLCHPKLDRNHHSIGPINWCCLWSSVMIEYYWIRIWVKFWFKIQFKTVFNGFNCR